MKRAEGHDSERVMLQVLEKRLKSPLELSSEDGQEVEDFNYRSDGAVAKERRSENMLTSLREQLLSVRSDSYKYRQHWDLYNKKFTMDVTNGFSGFLYNLRTEVKKLVAAQRHCNHCEKES